MTAADRDVDTHRRRAPVSTAREGCGGAFGLNGEPRPADDRAAAAPEPTPDASRASLLACLASSFLMMLGLGLYNGTLHVASEGVFAWSRDVSTTSQTVLILAVLVAARWRPRLLRPVPLALLTCALAVTGYTLSHLGTEAGSAAFVAIGSALEGAADAWGAVIWVLACSRVGLQRAAACISLAGTAAVAVAFPLNNGCSHAMVSAVACACAAGIPLLCVPPTRPFFRRLALVGIPAEQQVVQPKAFLPLSHAFFVYLFMFNVAFVLALRCADVSTLAVSSAANAVALVVCGVYALVLRDKVEVDHLFLMAYALVTAGLVLLLLGGVEEVASPLIVAGNMFMQLLQSLALCAVAARNTVDAIPAICWGCVVGNLGIEAGAAMWLVPGALPTAPHGADMTMLQGLVVATVLTILSVYMAATRRSFSFDDTIAAVAPESPAPVIEVQYVDLVDERCRELSSSHGLTARESQVLGLLARGHAPSRIQSELGVGYNTVKYHVRNVYAKLDVHGQQELIGLVTSAAGPAGGQRQSGAAPSSPDRR
jgi:DNA-binding CsgD family transcriptional regulator